MLGKIWVFHTKNVILHHCCRSGNAAVCGSPLRGIIGILHCIHLQMGISLQPLSSNMKNFLLTIIAFCMLMPAMARQRQAEVTFKTTMGDIVVVLYNDTPIHRDNFIRQVKSGTYDGVLFHRVIENFMIQSGDPTSKDAKPGQLLGEGDETPADRLTAEFRMPDHFHRRGVLAAAREGDDYNPEKKSSCQQFYIVTGRVFTEEELEKQYSRVKAMTGKDDIWTPEIREAYRSVGGAPHLDGSYTVFGEVGKGMEVVDKIQRVDTDRNNRPLEDIRILSAKVTKRPPRR